MSIDAHRAICATRLPMPYAAAVQLRDGGVADDVIADYLGLDREALPMFMRVAEAKLRAACDDAGCTDPSERVERLLSSADRAAER